MATSKKTAAPAKKSADKTASAKPAKGRAAAAPAAKEKSVSELINALAEKTSLPKAKVKELLDALAELLTAELQSAGSAQLSGIGKLKLGHRPERQGRNPSTGETITIGASNTVKFSGGKKFKDSFNG